MRLRRYAVLYRGVPMKVFWTLLGAMRWHREFIPGSVGLCRWSGQRWTEIG